jgi:AcrR family transcriptional regulator
MPDAQRGPYRTGIESRARIVAAAVDVFGRHGFRGATLRQVAAAVDMTAGGIIKLFGSKEELLIAVLEHWAVLARDVIGEQNHGLAQLEGFGRLMRFHMEHRGFLELYITMAAEAAAGDGHPAHSFIERRYSTTLADLRRLFTEGVVRGAFRPMPDEEIANEAECLLAVMDGLEIQLLLNPEFDLERSFRRYVGNLERRLAPLPEEARARAAESAAV